MKKDLNKHIRVIDICLSLLSIIILLPIFLFLAIILVSVSSPVVFRQRRVGRNGEIFVIYKFRTMEDNAPEGATHEVDSKHITKVGKLLRKFKIDELPQFVNVLKGEMSLVGPRPCLPSQREVIEQRAQNDLIKFRPGITGLAQIHNIDMSTPKRMARLDSRMMRFFSLSSYFRIIFWTVCRIEKLQ